MTADVERVLFVCTGNICRSPYLELRLRAGLARLGRQDILTASAGLQALVGHPVSRPLAKRLLTVNIDASRHRARQLVQAHVEQADLILTATRNQRRMVSQLLPEAADRVFTAAQFVRLLEVTAPRSTLSVRDQVMLANGARGSAGSSTAEDDILDPWKRSRRAYVRAGTLMDEVSDQLVRHLTA